MNYSVSLTLSPLLLVLAFNTSAHAEQLGDAYISELMSRMSLEEKIGQLTQYSSDMDSTGGFVREDYKREIMHGRVGSIFNAYTPRFTCELQHMAVDNSPNKIPMLFGYDVIHGHRTIFPIPLGESASWDLALLQKTARIATREATADGINWIFSPMVDIAHDPRWGRISEGSGEDTWLGSKISGARVKGIQGESLGNLDSALASVKHFAAYGAARGGRDYNSVDMSLQELFETYLPPFKAAVDAGVATIMTSFNDINGTPSTSNAWLLGKVLRGQWGWDGVVVSDYTSINELVPHGVAANEKDAAALALRAGVDIDMQGGLYAAHAASLLAEGRLTQVEIDRAVRRVLESKDKLGLLHDPYKNCREDRSAEELMKPAHLAHARESARKSIVLLKNDSKLLPLSQSGQRIALIGPLADNRRDLIGNWSAAGNWEKAISLKQGLEEQLARSSRASRLLYAKGANLIDDAELRNFLNQHGGLIEVDAKSPEALIEEAVSVALQADSIILALGESQGMSGEAASRTKLGLPENQVKLLRALAKTGKPIALVLFNGRPLVLSEEVTLATSIVETWFLGTESGRAIADVLFGLHNPSGKLTVSFPRSEGQIPVNYGQRNTGRPLSAHSKYSSRYIDSPNDALFPFGWGLSYTEFSYSAPRLSSTQMRMSDTIQVSVTVSNIGSREGEETVQLYLRDVVATTTRPSLQLRGFKKVFLKAGESRVVTLQISVEDLKFFDTNLVWQAEPGDFMVFTGGNSRELQSTTLRLID
jgi:beta-glucosidase